MNSIQKSMGSSLSGFMSLDDFRGVGLLAVLCAGALFQVKLYMDSGKTKPADSTKWTLESVQKRQASVEE